MPKEARRQELESAALPKPAVDNDVSLFERSAEGSVLRCTENYRDPVTRNVVFLKDERYLVVSTGEEGDDHLVLSTQEISAGSTVNYNDNERVYQWSEGFHPAMEDYFTDADEADCGPLLRDKYPEQIATSARRLEQMELPLFDFAASDAVELSQRRGGMDYKKMRMAKSSTFIASALLRGSQKIGIAAPRNGRIMWAKEMKRMGLSDYVIVNSLADLETPARWYLLTHSWLRRMSDPLKKQRNTGQTCLHPAYRPNPCPHCEQPLERFELGARPRIYGEGSDAYSYTLGRARANWTMERGYLCRNPECPEPGYVDYGLAGHVKCPPMKGRQRRCPTCGLTDSVWVPSRAKRMKKFFTAFAIDEGHNAKDIKTQTAQALYQFRAKYRQDLSGTGVSLGVTDMYWPLNWVFRGPCRAFPFGGRTGYKEFETRFCDHITLQRTIGVDENGVAITKSVSKAVPYLRDKADFWRMSGPWFLRRIYSDPLYMQSIAQAGLFVPKQSPQVVMCPMLPEQVRLMLSAMRNFREQYQAMLEESETTGHRLNSALIISQMTNMRNIATCPEMMNDKLGMEVYAGPHGGGKRIPLLEMANNYVREGRKILLISDFRAMERTAAELLAGYNPVVFNTGWSDTKREEGFRDFQEDPERKVFIAGTRAIRESVELSGADAVLCPDLLWSPGFQQQSWSRALAPTNRMRDVPIVMFVSEKSLDEQIYNVFYSRLVTSEQAMDHHNVGRRAKRIDVKWFVERILEYEQQLVGVLRDSGDNVEYLPHLDESVFLERAV